MKGGQRKANCDVHRRLPFNREFPIEILGLVFSLAVSEKAWFFLRPKDLVFGDQKSARNRGRKCAAKTMLFARTCAEKRALVTVATAVYETVTTIVSRVSASARFFVSQSGLTFP